MVTLLSKFFIRNRENVKDPAVRQAYGILCGAVGIALNLLLFGGKFAAGLISGSIAITADAFNNLSDAGSSVITLIGFKIAGQKPDSDHPFGHGRFEYISGFLVSVIILLMGVELLRGSIVKIIRPEKPVFSPVILGILIVSVLVKGYMFLYNKRLGKKLNSAAMAATATDSLSDMLATAVVFLSTLVSRFTDFNADGWCGILVGLFICYAGFSAARDTVSPLLGQAPDPEFVQQIKDIVAAHKEVLGIHDLIVHNYGPGRVLISLHAEVPADGSIIELHEVIDNIEHELHNTLSCQAVIHMDPVRVGDKETERQKKMVEGILAEIEPALTMHDFHIACDRTHTSLIFDVVTPYGFRLSDTELVELIDRKVKAGHPDYHIAVDVDKL
ncbi:MAG: cation diffusion facilitator family transporter [Butyrivibrio sp.]|nr:cation diffusion facilitator family transporter [Acetatifactor muris]MCM1560116.1 cation diffusion facilitator family transporter [Butyrivibrio sp.]